ncbi:hypothetical protein [Rhizobium sp. BR 315]|uniref:hypothetical protein n=1 Tax=Rhizobium sp. BR 315 TaxID=3040014 RepID=UPI003D34EC6A
MISQHWDPAKVEVSGNIIAVSASGKTYRDLTLVTFSAEHVKANPFCAVATCRLNNNSGPDFPDTYLVGIHKILDGEIRIKIRRLDSGNEPDEPVAINILIFT